MDDVQTISSDEEDDSWPDRPYCTPGWFRPNVFHADVSKSSLTAENCDSTQVQNTRTVFHDIAQGAIESRKRGRLSDQDPSFASRKRPYIDFSTDSEPQQFPGTQQGRLVKNTNSGFSAISQDNLECPDRRKNPYPEPARHSPFHFFLKTDNICKSPEQGSDLHIEFDITSPVFNTCRRPSQLLEPVEVLSSDDSEDSYIWTSSQMVAPQRNFHEQKKSETPDIISSDDEIAPSQLDPRLAKKVSTLFAGSLNGRTATDGDCDHRDWDRTTSGVESSLSESESPILRRAPEIIPCLKSSSSDVRTPVSSGFQQIRDPMGPQSGVFMTPETGAQSSFKIPVIVADCDNQSHTSCRSFSLNIAPLSSLTSQAAATRTNCVQVPSLQPSSGATSECRVVLNDTFGSCGDVGCSCHARSLPDRGQQVLEARSSGDQQPTIEHRPLDATLGIRSRRWSISWDRSDSESQSVLGNPADQGVSQSPVEPVTPVTWTMGDHRQSGIHVSIQRLSAQVNPDMFSDDDLFDDYAMTQCDEAVAKALRSNDPIEFKKPFDVVVHDNPTKVPQNPPSNKIEVGCQCELSGDARSTELPPVNLYSQLDDCIILSDSDDELFANLTQASMNPMAVRDSDDETVDDGWNDDDDDIDATMLMMDESCFVVPLDDNVIKVEPIAENVIRVEPTVEDWNEEGGGRSEHGKMLPGLVDDAKSYGEVEVEVEDVPQFQLSSVVKEKDICESETRGSALKRSSEFTDVKSFGNVEVDPEDVAYMQECRQITFIKEEDVLESRHCRSVVKSPVQEVAVPIKILCSLPYQHSTIQDSSQAKIHQFASIGTPKTAEDSGSIRGHTSDAEEDDISIGELIDKQKVQQGLKRYREVHPIPVWTLAMPNRSPEKTSEFDVESDEGETALPRFDTSRGCLLLPKDVKIRDPPEILEVEVDEEPAQVPVETSGHDLCEGRVIKSEKQTDFPGELESDAEEEDENFRIHLKDDETKVTKVNYLKCDELEKSELVLKYYKFTEGDQWLSKTSPEKPRVHPVGGLARKRRTPDQKRKVRSSAVPEKRKKRSMSEDQGLKIAQLREGHVLLKKKTLRASSDIRSCEKGSKIDRSIKNAKNVMQERPKQVEKENKDRTTDVKTSCRREKAPGKISVRRKTVPAIFTSPEKSSMGSVPRPTTWDEKQGSAAEVPISVLDSILGPVDSDSVSAGFKKNNANRPGTVVTTSDTHDRASRKHSKIPDRISERSFKRSTSSGVRSREKGTEFKIPRLSFQVAKVTPTAVLAPNTPVAECVGTKAFDVRSPVAPEPDSKDALAVKQTKVATARRRDSSKEKTSNQSDLSKRNLDGTVLERKSDLVGLRAGVDVRKTLSVTRNSAKSPQQSPFSVSSKSSSSKSIATIVSSLSKCVPNHSGTAAPLKSSSVAPKPSGSSTSKSSSHVVSKSLPYTSKSSSSVASKAQSSSGLLKSLDVLCNLPSKSKKDEPQHIKSISTSVLNSERLNHTRSNHKTPTSKGNAKSSGASSDRRDRAKESEKRESRNYRVSYDDAAVRRSRSDNSRMADRKSSVSADVEKSSMLEREKLGDDLVGTTELEETYALPDKPRDTAFDATSSDIGGQTSDVRLLGQGLLNGDRHVMQRVDRTATSTEQRSSVVADTTGTVATDPTSKVQLGQPLSGTDKHIMQPPDRTRTTAENQSKIRDKLLFDQKQIARKIPSINQPVMVSPPVNDLVENHLETTNKSVENLGGNMTDAMQAPRPDLEGLFRSGFVEPAVPTAVIRPLTERDPRRGAREVVRTTAPALGREMESITLSQIVNDSIRKTGPMPSPLLSEAAPRRKVQPDVVHSNRQPERESRKLTDLPRAKIDMTAVLSKDVFTSTILFWNPAWMKECETVKFPPPIVNYDKVYPLLDTYDSFADYANILQPLMLLEMWESMIKDWKEGQRLNRQRSSKVIATYLRIEKEQKHMFLHCQGVVTQQENAAGRCLRESDLVILNLRAMPVSPNGQQPNPSLTVNKPVFGIISKVNRHVPGRTQEPLNPKIEELKKSIGERCFIITYIIELAYRKQGIDNSEFISVEPVTSILSILRQFSGLANLPRSTLAAEILRPSQWEVFHHNVEIGVNQLKERFNPSQRDAISKIAKAVLDPYFPPKICLLQGPPGTGKSHTVIGLVEHLLAQNGNFHILLCAPSNAGIDELCRRLIASNRLKKPGSRKEISFVRLGAMSSIHADINPYSLQILAKKKYEQQQRNAPTSVQSTLMSLEQKQKEWKTKLDKCLKENNTNEVEIARKELKTLEKRRESISGGLSRPMSAAEEVRMKKAVLMGVDVVCTTLNHSGSQHIVDMMYHQDATRHHFGCVIVDEACQCTEVDCLIPLQYRSSKLVLVGDPEQLPPTVLSKKAGDMIYGQSLFERLYNQLKPAPSSNQSNPVLMLETQYRMHEDICLFSNKHFYNGRLKTNPSTAERRREFGYSAFTVFDLQYTYERTDQRSASFSNPEEANFIVQLCQHLASWMTPEKAVENIGIITPYQGQKTHILEQLRCMELGAIEVGTVDGFQGREKDVMIVSCVRANSSRNIGFLSDRRRMNVSLTRAKYALYIVGHMKTLTSNPDWSALVADAQHRGRLVKVMTAQQSVSQIQHGCNKP